MPAPVVAAGITKDAIQGVMAGAAEGLRILAGRGARTTTGTLDPEQGKKVSPEELAEMREIERLEKEQE